MHAAIIEILRRRILFALILFCYSIIGVSQSVNDSISNAIQIDTLKGTCSADAEYSTLNCTPDLYAGSNWSVTDSLHNVWFEFTAPQNGRASFTIDIGSGKGTQTRSQGAIWSGIDTSEINSVRYDGAGDDLVIAADSLTPGATYYLSVDAQRASRTGTFTLCFDSILDYDFISAALNVDSLKGTCSGDAAFTTIGGSPDGVNGDCFAGTGPKANRWFEFTAAQNGVAVFTVDIGDTKGDQTRTQVALWQNDGATQLNCARYDTNGDDIELATVGLTVGTTYLLSVDVQALGRRGSFTLCYDTITTYDYALAPIVIDSLKGTCSSDAEYTTVGGTPDRMAGDCWNNVGPLYNRWFKFTGPSTGQVSITIDIGSGKGTQLRTQAAIFNSDTSTQVACSRYSNNEDDVTVSSASITPEAEYFLSVDAFSGRQGTFSICFDTTVTYDYYSEAINIDTLKNTCSLDAEYTTIGASADLNAASCWNNSGPLLNRWFQFTAPQNGFARFTVDIGGAKGDQTRTQAAIWKSGGADLIACQRYVADGDDVEVSSDTLIPGSTYYLSVDVQAVGRAGSFSLCYDTIPDYDYLVGAIDIDTILGGCSSDAEYTTSNASADRTSGDCWNNSGPLYNRWFKFTAPTNGTVNINVKIDGSEGTQRRTQAALFESDGSTQVVCNRYAAGADDVELNSDALTSGNTYYLVVDAFSINQVGTFTICVDTTPSYDFYDGAIDVTSLFGGCSPDAAYTTVGGTPDRNAGANWNNSGPLFNRWFKFTAPTNGIANITVDIGDTKGTQRRSQLALWESNGTTEVASVRYDSNPDDIQISKTGLTGGATYYISVDAFSASQDGTFTLCLDSNPSYDYFAGAYEITDLNNWCSEDEQFTTAGASGDLNAGDCWNNGGPLFNRWFKFTALSTDFTVTVDINDGKGDQRRTQLALWDGTDTSQVDCQRYSAGTDDVTISTTALTAGKIYYISVDVQDTGRVGTFTLCASNVAGAYYSRLDGNWDSTSTWSATGFGGPSAGVIPGPGDVVYIEGAIVTVTGTDSVAGIGINANLDSTGLIINGGTLEVLGSINDTSSTNYYNGIRVINSGTLNVSSNLTLNRTGGSEVNELDVEGGSSVDIGADFIINSSSGTINNNNLNITGSLTISDDFNLVQTGTGIKTKCTVRNSGVLTVKDIDFSATGDDVLEIELNNTSTLKVSGDITRGSPAYGILVGNDSSTVEFNGSSAQTLPTTTGSGTGDNFSYAKVIVNNTFSGIPQLTMDGVFSFDYDFAFTDGIVFTNGNNFNVNFGSTISGGNSGSYLDGKMVRTGFSDFTYQIGDGSVWAPVDLTGGSAMLPTDVFEVEYFGAGYSDTTTVGDEIVYVSTIEYWTIDYTNGTGSVDVTLHWKDSARSGISEPTDLAVGHFDGADWESYGLSTSSAGEAGSITASSISDFSPFTFGFKTAPIALPVELINFDVTKTEIGNLLEWSTAAEINNDRFEIECSYDGVNFQTINVQKGQGNTSMLTNYTWIDETAEGSNTYYRLKQIDFDGTFSYSSIQIVTNDQLNQENILVYPNPILGNVIYVKGVKNYNNLNVKLYSSSGILIEEVFSPSINSNTYTSIQFSVKPSSGVYYLAIPGGSSIAWQRIVFK